MSMLRLNPGWVWNQSEEFPTISPSVSISHSEMACHSFIKDGKIQYLQDTCGGEGHGSFSGTTQELLDYD